MIALPHEAKHVEKIEALIGKAIEPMPLPEGAGAVGTTDDRADEPVERRSRERSAPRPAPRAAPVGDAETPEAVSQRAPRHAEPPPRRDTPHPRDAGRDPAREAGRDASRETSRDSGRDSGRSRDRRDAPVVGLGDHVPAFLLREVPQRMLARRAADETGSEEAA
jgi:hypothetical protein